VFKLGEGTSRSELWTLGLFLIFFVDLTRQAGGLVYGDRCRWALPLWVGGGLGIATDIATAGLGAPGAGAPPPGSPPRWAPLGPSAVVSAAHAEPGRVGCRLWGIGAAVCCPKWPVPLSWLFGGGLESHRNPLKSVGTASGWCGVGHHHVPRPSVREDIRANALDPPRIQNPGLKLCLMPGE
jgi:hypothetical protein